MKDEVKDIMVSRFCFSINPLGAEVTRTEFEEHLKAYPKATTYNYSNATVLRHPWMGEMEWIAMHEIRTGKYYIIDGD